MHSDDVRVRQRTACRRVGGEESILATGQAPQGGACRYIL